MIIFEAGDSTDFDRLLIPLYCRDAFRARKIPEVVGVYGFIRLAVFFFVPGTLTKAPTEGRLAVIEKF